MHPAETTEDAGEIRVNRAPVLTLWAAVVAERLGYDADAAITPGRALASASARTKARAIGLEAEPMSTGDLQDEAAGQDALRRPQDRTVRLLGHGIPVVQIKAGLRARDGGKPAHAGAARSYVERAFGHQLAAVRSAMEALANSLPPDELNRRGFRLYEAFRPDIPAGAKGWGAKGTLDLHRIRQASR